MRARKRMPTYWPPEIWCSRVMITLGLLLGGLSPFIQGRDGRLISIVAALTLVVLGLSFWLIRRKEAREIARFEQRAGIEGSAFLAELGIPASSPLAEKVLAVRDRLAELGGVPPESLRATDRLSDELQHLPFYDSLDALGIMLILEDEFGHVPEEEKRDLLQRQYRDPVAIRDLILWAIEANQQRT